jgi:urease accessory protein
MGSLTAWPATGGSQFALMLLGDARLPSGGHTQSAGLEAALSGGMPGGDLPAYLQMRLLTVAAVDAGTAVAALAALSGASTAGLSEVQQHWAARTPNHVQRQASTMLGRGLVRLLRSLFPTAAATQRLGDVPTPCRPVVLAGLAAELGLDPEELATVVCYDEVQTVTAAALKLMPLDPVQTVRWALGARPVVAQVVTECATVTEPEQIPARSAPLMDHWMVAHARQNRRLFSA